MPDLHFQVESAEVAPYAAAPTLQFKMHIKNLGGEAIRSVTLQTQIRIQTSQRHYTPDEQERLVDVFGETHRWAETLRPLLWAHVTVLVPPFTGSCMVEMPVPCTYDFDVVSVKYFHSLGSGEIPLEFLFSGTIFYTGDVGLQVSQISWEKEAHYRLPVDVWKAMMEIYFPNSAWLRLRKDVFDSLYHYKVLNGLATWENAVERLLRTSEEAK